MTILDKLLEKKKEQEENESDWGIMTGKIISGELILYIVNKFYPHDMDFEHGNFLAPVYLTLEDAITNHPGQSVIKLHQTIDKKQELNIVYNGKEKLEWQF